LKSRLIVVLIVFSVIIGCDREKDPNELSSFEIKLTATTPVSTPPSPLPTDTVINDGFGVVVIPATVTPNITPDREVEVSSDPVQIMGSVKIDFPVQQFQSSILLIPDCRVENAPQASTSIYIGTVPMPTPTPSPDLSPPAQLSAGEVSVQRYVKTVYPSVATALGWATAVATAGAESLDDKQVLSLLHMESSRLEAVCEAVALISPTEETDAFHIQLFRVLLDRHAALSEVRDMGLSTGDDASYKISMLTNSLVNLEQISKDLEHLTETSGMEYPPPLTGLVFASIDLGLELLIPPGWQLTNVSNNLSLLAPPRMQGARLQDVGSHFRANGSEFVYSSLRNPSDFSDRTALDRIKRLMQPYGEFTTEIPSRIASLDGHVLEFVDLPSGVTSKVWVITLNGISKLFRVSCPANVIDSCTTEVMSMLDSAKIYE
jgi:hypothetical protein